MEIKRKIHNRLAGQDIAISFQPIFWLTSAASRHTLRPHEILVFSKHFVNSGGVVLLFSEVVLLRAEKVLQKGRRI
jgi:hypothetical protein